MNSWFVALLKAGEYFPRLGWIALISWVSVPLKVQYIGSDEKPIWEKFEREWAETFLLIFFLAFVKSR
jgi:hypothetical protein